MIEMYGGRRAIIFGICLSVYASIDLSTKLPSVNAHISRIKPFVICTKRCEAYDLGRSRRGKPYSEAVAQRARLLLIDIEKKASAKISLSTMLCTPPSVSQHPGRLSALRRTRSESYGKFLAQEQQL